MNTLEKICANKRTHVASMRRLHSLHAIEQAARRAAPVRGFHRALTARIAEGNAALIAEIKKASPSKGIIRADFHPATHAADYETGGAACLSVLTDAPYFQGDDCYLPEARNACTLPVLRKDFIIDEYQIAESRALGADCILLIIAALDIHHARALECAAMQYGMDVLVEVHDRAELELALSHLQSRLIGINNRNLKDFRTDLAITESLAPLIASDYTIICESGIHTHAEVERIRAHGVHGFLVGESLMRCTNVAAATRQLLGRY